nr:MAG TPA_asm: hypothetical protein [Caudoviricetes sp.]
MPKRTDLLLHMNTSTVQFPARQQTVLVSKSL